MQQTISDNIAAQQEDQVAVSIPFRDLSIHGHLYIPEKPAALAIISHGSGSSRFNSRNNYVARSLSNSNIAAFLVDLLTPGEDSLIENRFDIPVLTERLKHVTNWALHYLGLKKLPVGYLGAGTGAASALAGAASWRHKIKAVVCMGGRPDLVRDSFLPLVACPTLLIVGGLDNEVIKLNMKAFQDLTCKKRLIIVNSASHLFEEPGKLHIVSELASGWFEKCLVQKN